MPRPGCASVSGSMGLPVWRASYSAAAAATGSAIGMGKPSFIVAARTGAAINAARSHALIRRHGRDHQCSLPRSVNGSRGPPRQHAELTPEMHKTAGPREKEGTVPLVRIDVLEGR